MQITNQSIIFLYPTNYYRSNNDHIVGRESNLTRNTTKLNVKDFAGFTQKGDFADPILRI